MAIEVKTAYASSMRFAALSPDDLDRVYALHLAATQAVGRPDLIKAETREFFERILNGAGRVIGAFRDGELVAYGVLQLELPSSEDARPLLGLTSRDRLAKLAGASVLPEFWGAGIHDELIDRRIAEARSRAVDHLYSTSAPGNARSWANLMAAGFMIRGVIEKYGGHLRYLLYRDLSAAPPGDGDGIWCDAADIVRQRLLIANGFVGTRWRRRDDGRDIYYRDRA